MVVDSGKIYNDPYGELRFEGKSLPSVKAFDKIGCVFCLGTFSKIFRPGYRIGWVAGDQEAIAKYIIVKQGTELQCKTGLLRESNVLQQ